jgi:uncharacterized membrane protein
MIVMPEPMPIFEKPTKREERQIHKVFLWSIAIKGFDAVVESAAGVALIFVKPSVAIKLAVILTQGELVEDPNSAIANYIVKVANDFAISSHTFLIWYLIIHGVIKVILVGGLLLDKKWSYPLAIAVLSIFAGYQILQYTYTPSLWLLVLTLFDFFVLALIWHEYRYGRKIRGVL